MDKLKKVSDQIKQAEEQAKRTKGLNYRKYNSFIVDKGVEKDQASKARRGAEANQIIEGACDEAARGIHRTMKSRTFHIFGG